MGTEIVAPLFDVALVVEHVVDAVEQTSDVKDVLDVKVLEFFTDIIHGLYGFSSEACFWNLIIIILVKAASISLNRTSDLRNFQVDLPHFFSSCKPFLVEIGIVIVDPLFLLITGIDFLLPLLDIIDISMNLSIDILSKS